MKNRGNSFPSKPNKKNKNYLNEQDKETIKKLISFIIENPMQLFL